MFPQISSNLLKSLHIGSHCLSSYFLPLKAAWASVHYFDNSNTDNLLSKIHFPWTYSSLSRWTDICGNMMCGYLWECNSPMTPLQTICLIVISPIILAVITHHYHHQYYQSHHQIRINHYHFFAFGESLSKFLKSLTNLREQILCKICLLVEFLLLIFSCLLWQWNLSFRDNLASVSSNSLSKHYGWWWW